MQFCQLCGSKAVVFRAILNEFTQNLIYPSPCLWKMQKQLAPLRPNSQDSSIGKGNGNSSGATVLSCGKYMIFGGSLQAR